MMTIRDLISAILKVSDNLEQEIFIIDDYAGQDREIENIYEDFMGDIIIKIEDYIE